MHPTNPNLMRPVNEVAPIDPRDTLRCGDIVRHRPSGEEWVVAYADGDYLSWVGWPYGEAKISDCDLERACSDHDHVALLIQIVKSSAGNADKRQREAHKALLKIAETTAVGSVYQTNYSRFTAAYVATLREMDRAHAIYEAERLKAIRLEKEQRDAMIELLEHAYAS